MSRLVDTLEKLGDEMERRPWIRGSVHDRQTDGVCLMGGINAVVNGNARRNAVTTQGRNLELQVMRALWRAIKRIDDHLPGHIPTWNDHHAKDKQQVLDVIRDAAKHERMKEEGLIDH